MLYYVSCTTSALPPKEKMWKFLFPVYVISAYISAAHAIPIRLRYGSDTEGRVQVYHGGRWGDVCGKTWGDLNAKVVCRQLGFSEGRAVDHMQFAGPWSWAWLKWVFCLGREDALADCAYADWERVRCDPTEGYAAVRCGSSMSDFQLLDAVNHKQLT